MLTPSYFAFFGLFCIIYSRICLPLSSLELGMHFIALKIIVITDSGIFPVIEIGEVICHIITDHSKTARPHIHRYTNSCIHRIQQNTCNTLPPNAPQPKWMTQSTIKMDISSSGMHTFTLFNRTDTTLSHHQIPKGITQHTYLFPFWQWHTQSSIGTHTHTSCGHCGYQ